MQFAQTSLCACTPFTHTLTHTQHLLAGAVEAGEFLLRSHTETLPFSLSLPLSLRGDLYLCISKQTQSAPTNSISCGRPLPNFPLLYSSLSLCYNYLFILIPCLHFLFSLISISTSHLPLSLLSFHLISILILCCSHPEKQGCYE